MRSIEDMAARLANALPPQAAPLRDEVIANFRAVLQSQLSQLDLVPREEFEATRDMLTHARARLAELEQRLDKLEANEQQQQ
ncbi:accessory factor UbiK family protein [Salinisphaera sp. SPP-AMP-43]|uniref:accessory factor UbiK family protein n=1 Tax=Salinisphaera sp. SPP-AMP-43 TaxID=3121288 RepID=UPI003C6DF5F3